MDSKRHKNPMGLDLTYTINAQKEYEAFISLLILKQALPLPDRSLLPHEFLKKVQALYQCMLDLETALNETEANKETLAETRESFSEEEKCFYKKLLQAVKQFELPPITQNDLIQYYRLRMKQLPAEEQQISMLHWIAHAVSTPEKFQEITFMKFDAQRARRERMQGESACNTRFFRVTKMENLIRICTQVFGPFLLNDEKILSFFKEKITHAIEMHFPQKTKNNRFILSVEQLCQLLNIMPNVMNSPACESSHSTSRFAWITEGLKSIPFVRMRWFSSEKETDKGPNQSINNKQQVQTSQQGNVTAMAKHGSNNDRKRDANRDRKGNSTNGITGKLQNGSENGSKPFGGSLPLL